MEFRRNRSCTDHITALLITVEHSLEWNSSLYVTFVDFEKVFDNVDHATLWMILCFYGVPEKFISLIKASYSDSKIRVEYMNAK